MKKRKVVEKPVVGPVHLRDELVGMGFLGKAKICICLAKEYVLRRCEEFPKKGVRGGARPHAHQFSGILYSLE